MTDNVFVGLNYCFLQGIVDLHRAEMKMSEDMILAKVNGILFYKIQV